jgi:hypothetical protein
MALTIPTKDDPQLLDLLLDDIAAKLETALPWLNNSFGKCERLSKTAENGRIEYSPAIFTGKRRGKDYFELWPNTELGNFCFFDVPELQNLQGQPTKTFRRIRTQIGQIFWFDFRKVYGANAPTRTVENVKAEVLEAYRDLFSTHGSIHATGFADRVEEVYKNYNHREVEKQFQMRPFGCFRLNLEVQYMANC